MTEGVYEHTIEAGPFTVVYRSYADTDERLVDFRMDGKLLGFAMISNGGETIKFEWLRVILNEPEGYFLPMGIFYRVVVAIADDERDMSELKADLEKWNAEASAG